VSEWGLAGHMGSQYKYYEGVACIHTGEGVIAAVVLYWF
jgi:hypothetical protein